MVKEIRKDGKRVNCDRSEIHFARTVLKIRVSVVQHKSGQLTNDQSAANGIAPVQDPGGLGSID